MKKRKGTPIGYQHNWKYKEKDKSKNNKILMYQIKKRNKPTKHMGGFKKGSKIIWNIDATEKIRKTRKGYQHTITGIKRQEAYKIKGKRWAK